MTAVRAWVAALFLVGLPLAGCLELSSQAADRVGLDRSDQQGDLPIHGCGNSSEDCETP